MKIAIMGYYGSGKTYLANRFSQVTFIPTLNLEAVQYTEDWTKVDESIALEEVSAFMRRDEWIIDGANLLLKERLDQADFILIMLFPRVQCLYRVLKRAIKEGRKKDINWKFIRFVLFDCRNKERRKEYRRIINEYGKKVVVFREEIEVNSYFDLYVKAFCK